MRLGSARLSFNSVTYLPAAFFVVGLAACGGSSASSIEEVTALRIPFGELSEYQQVAFSDGEISFSEYEAAVFDHVDCLRSGGIVAYDPVLEDDKSYSYSTVDPSPGGEGTFSATLDGCEKEYLFAIEYGWADANTPEPEEEERFYAAITACLSTNGVEIESASPADLGAAAASNGPLYDECVELALAGDE